MSIWNCPVCGGDAERCARSLVCGKGHTFDYARSGYVNLLPVNRKRTKDPGDNALMVQARRSFLSKDYYKPLSDQLCEVMNRLCPAEGVLLDAGCGEGYYTKNVAEALAASGKPAAVYGVDIAKCAVDAAAKSCKSAEFAVGSIFHLPVSGESCDALMSLFAPYCGGEFQRVLKPKGKMVLVIPGTMHLMGLKEAIYDTPYANEVQNYELEGFVFLGAERVDGEIFLKDPEDIRNLFSMTPYYYKTGREEHRRLEELTELRTQISFEVLQYEKEV
ncbi:MAG: methyltransferase domain-containing protein [Ruminococcus sp.]|nr:methyltransferase domain-containing protein [Ruminococcus sp.]